jgi:hypothetical protein
MVDEEADLNDDDFLKADANEYGFSSPGKMQRNPSEYSQRKKSTNALK